MVILTAENTSHGHAKDQKYKIMVILGQKYHGSILVFTTLWPTLVQMKYLNLVHSN